MKIDSSISINDQLAICKRLCFFPETNVSSISSGDTTNEINGTLYNTEDGSQRSQLLLLFQDEFFASAFAVTDGTHVQVKY
jgi:hypothetical protein